jgi:hypothetical protein
MPCAFRFALLTTEYSHLGVEPAYTEAFGSRIQALLTSLDTFQATEGQRAINRRRK